MYHRLVQHGAAVIPVIFYYLCCTTCSYGYVMLVRLKKIAAIRAALEDCVEQLPEVDCLRAGGELVFFTFNISVKT